MNKRLAKKHILVREDENGALQQITRDDLFLEAFLRHNGNATNAAMEVYNCKSRSIASSIASRRLKKLRGLGKVYLEEKGYTFGRMLDIATRKMEDAKSPDWWDRLMSIANFPNPLAEKQAKVGGNVVNIIQTEKDLLKKYTDGEIAEAEELSENETEKVSDG